MLQFVKESHSFLLRKYLTEFWKTTKLQLEASRFLLKNEWMFDIYSSVLSIQAWKRQMLVNAEGLKEGWEGTEDPRRKKMTRGKWMRNFESLSLPTTMMSPDSVFHTHVKWHEREETNNCNMKDTLIHHWLIAGEVWRGRKENIGCQSKEEEEGEKTWVIWSRERFWLFSILSLLSSRLSIFSVVLCVQETVFELQSFQGISHRSSHSGLSSLFFLCMKIGRRRKRRETTETITFTVKKRRGQ